MVACAPLLKRPLIPEGADALDPTAVTEWRISFVVVAAFFALFAIPTFVYLRERPVPEKARDESYFMIGYHRVRDTVTHLRKHRDAGKLVLAYLFFYGGIETVMMGVPTEMKKVRVSIKRIEYAGGDKWEPKPAEGG